MSPLLKSVEQVGHAMTALKARPYNISGAMFFQFIQELKQVFAELVQAEHYNRIAIIPSASYGIASVAKNLALKPSQKIILAGEQFPSNYYSWEKLATQTHAQLLSIPLDFPFEEKFQLTHDWLLDQIDDQTAVVAISQVHWADGFLFDLKAIREKTWSVGAQLIIDGTQSLGALPFNIKEIQPDALICAGYKWLLGPYALGVAYFSEKYDQGDPIEENWINRLNSENFAGLVNYESNYQPMSSRYSVGEQSNFILTPMLTEGIRRILTWTPEAIQDYCAMISRPFTDALINLGCKIAPAQERANHLFGVQLPNHVSLEALKIKLKQNQVFVSIRGTSIRISPHLYNREEDFNLLLDCFKEVVR